MFNRSGLFILAIIACFGIPYFMSANQAGTRARIAHVWDKMFTDTISDRYPRQSRYEGNGYESPISSTSPLPTSRRRQRIDSPPWEYRPADRVAQFPVERSPRRGFTPSRTTSRPMVQPSFVPSVETAPYAQGTYSHNPLEGIAPEQGATEWKTVGPASGATITTLPIPYSSQVVSGGPIGQPDEEGWVTVGPAHSYTGNPAVGSVGGVATYPSVPSGAEILPGIVVGGPGSAVAGRSGRTQYQPQDIAQLLDFEHAPDWVLNSWPRVSTHIIQQDLSGMRVPLVSGTNPQDLAGSLSYYFDRGQTLQRISFEGATGDPTRLIKVLTEAHDLKAEPSLGGGMYVSRNSDVADPVDSISSVLRLRRAPVVRDSRPLQKYLVMLEMTRPDSNLTISKEFARLLQLDRRSRRWAPGSTSATERPPVPLDPRDPFSPANPNDADPRFIGSQVGSPPLPRTQPAQPIQPNGLANPNAGVPSATTTPTPSARPVPRLPDTPGGTLQRGVLPSGNRFQSQTLRGAPQIPRTPDSAATTTQPRNLKTRMPQPSLSPAAVSQPNPLRCQDPNR